MEQQPFDLFSFLGMEPKQPEKKEEKAPAKKAEKKNMPKKDKKKEKLFKFPEYMVIPYIGSVSLENKENRENISENDLKEILADKWSLNLPEGKNLVLEEHPGNIVVKYSRYSVISKGEINGLSADAQIVIGTLSIPLAGLKTVEDINTFLVAQHEEFAGLSYGYIVNKDRTGIIPVCVNDPYVYSMAEDGAEEEEELPKATMLYVHGIGRQSLEDTSENTVRSSIEVLAGGAYSQACEIYVSDSGIHALIPTGTPGTSGTDTSSSARADVFNISSGVELSLSGWCKIPISPESFNGKTTVKKEDICSYLIAEGYPEYTAGRTVFEWQNKEKKNGLLIAILKSASKGI